MPKKQEIINLGDKKFLLSHNKIPKTNVFISKLKKKIHPSPYFTYYIVLLKVKFIEWDIEIPQYHDRDDVWISAVEEANVPSLESIRD